MLRNSYLHWKLKPVVLFVIISLVLTSGFIPGGGVVWAQTLEPPDQSEGFEQPAETPTPQPTQTPDPGDDTLTPDPTQEDRPDAEETPLPDEGEGESDDPVDELEPDETDVAPTAPVTDEAGLFTWHLLIDLAIPGVEVQAMGGVGEVEEDLAGALATKLDGHMLSYDVRALSSSEEATVFQLGVDGVTSLDELRQVAFADLSPQVDLLGGPILLTIIGLVEQDQILPVLLESRPATGYVWALVEDETTIFSQVGEAEVEARAEGAGMPVVETLQLQANQEGGGRIQLLYHRPWERDAPVTRHITLHASDLLEVVDFSSPPGAFEESPVLEIEDGGPLEEVMALAGSASLPSSWDWRTLGKVTPVRNQGGCGSCWAFGTVGVMESAILIAGGSATDLSEQYLVSCNTNGYSCNGGWWAHSYHVDRLGKSQTDSGAVLESAKPYTATNGTCTVAYNHPYKAYKWHFITGYSIPTVDQIKAAIYNYGPVSAAVCVAGGFSGYRSGIFTENNTCGGSPNHAVVLVGWNDADQTWIMRNSWGSGWGENGYMRIRWGKSLIGYAASYLEYVEGGTIAPPANDDFDDAIAADHAGGILDFQDQQNTVAATVAEDDPVFPIGQGYQTVWYRFTPASSGRMKVNTLGSGYDTVLGVWRGERGSLELRAWNDNVSGKKQSSLNIPVVAGDTYYIEVASKTDRGGALRFRLQFTPDIPLNNSIGKAILIEEGEGVLEYANLQDVTRATAVSADPRFPYDSPARKFRTVWYRFVPKSSGTLIVDTASSSYDTILGVWTGSTKSLRLVAWNDDWNGTYQSRVETPLVGGAPYWIEVASYYNSGVSMLQFNLRFEPVTPVGSGEYLSGDSNLVSLGNWGPNEQVGAYHTPLFVSTQRWGMTALTFYGDRVRLVYSKIPTGGVLNVVIDGVRVAQINQKAAIESSNWQWASGVLGSPGWHTLTLTHQSGKTVNLDAIIVDSAPGVQGAGLLDDASAMLDYRGIWRPSTDQDGALNDTLMTSYAAKNTTTLDFDGSQITLVYSKIKKGGILRVMIDGVTVARIKQNAVFPSHQLEWSSAPLPPGPHRLTLVHQSGSLVNLDAVVIHE